MPAMDKGKALTMALQYTDSAIAIDADKQSGNLDNLYNEYYNLSQIQSLMGDYKSALKSYQLYSTYKDSVLNQENQQKQ